MYSISNNKKTSVEVDFGKIVDKYIININISPTDNFFNVKALIDTGANCSCISKELVYKLKLVPIDIVTISTPSSIAQVNVFVVNFKINDVVIENVRVCDSNIGNQGIDLLLGTDIISIGDLMISNYDSKTILSFRLPSESDLNF